MPVRVIGSAGQVIGCFYRDSGGTIKESEPPKGEPDPYDVPASLHVGAYVLRARLFRPPQLVRGDILIFNRRDYRPDLELEAYVKQRIKEAILREVGVELLAEAGGANNLEIVVDTFWREAKD